MLSFEAQCNPWVSVSVDSTARGKNADCDQSIFCGRSAIRPWSVLRGALSSSKCTILKILRIKKDRDDDESKSEDIANSRETAMRAIPKDVNTNDVTASGESVVTV
jgi:hypothetical protein